MAIRSIISKIFSDGRGGLSYDRTVPNPHCSEFEVNNWDISRFVIDRLVPIVGVHPFPLNEQMLMVSAVCRLKPTHIFEWGTNIGVSARIFYETCAALGFATEIHSIDLPDDMEHAEHPGRKRGYMVKGISAVKLHVGDGLDTSLRILAEAKELDLCPLFFLDGDHDYSSVKRELETILERVPQASVLMHDTFRQAEESGYNTGPCRALDDVLKAKNITCRILSQNLGLPGMSLVWRTRQGEI